MKSTQKVGKLSMNLDETWHGWLGMGFLVKQQFFSEQGNVK
jgi:hypothetical protein